MFLGFGDRVLIDGSLNGMASLTRRAAGRLSRIETGSLQLYLLLAVLGVLGALVWVWRHG